MRYRHPRLLQRSIVRMSLRDAARRGSAQAQEILSSDSLFNEVEAILVNRYIKTTNAAHTLDDADGTPILDSLLDFIKWMYESGFLEFLLGLFAGMGTLTTQTIQAQLYFIYTGAESVVE